VQSLVGKPKRKDHWVVLGMEGRMILKWIWRSRMGGCGLD
jgi:hypothetical protein